MQDAFVHMLLHQARLSHLLTAESVRMVAIGDLMFFRSHTFTVRSSLPDTTLSPTVNTADVTVLKKKKTSTHCSHAKGPAMVTIKYLGLVKVTSV